MVASIKHITIVLVCVTGLIWTANKAQPVRAQTFQVTQTGDEISSGGCDAECTLREAIIAANTNPGADVIVLPAGQFTLAIPGMGDDSGNLGDLDITEAVTIRGAGSDSTIIDANHLDRIFHVLEDAQAVFIENLAVINGSVADDDPVGGGGILNLGALTLTDVRLEGNSASRGGGLRNSLGDVVVNASQVITNTASEDGGGIYNDGLMIIVDTEFSDNRARRGGGLGNSGELTASQLTVFGNHSTAVGGGVFSDNNLTISQSRLSGNRAENGGGIYNSYDSNLSQLSVDHNYASLDGAGIYSEGYLELTSVTVSANQADWRGGGIFNAFEARLQNDTLFGNQAIVGGGIYNSEDGITTIDHSILAGNSIGNCLGNGVIDSLGFNLEDDDICGFESEGDQVQTDPMLTDLIEYEPGVWLHAFLANSPAIDSGDEADCALIDQRDAVRSSDGDLDGFPRCDLGAFELVTQGWLGFAPVEYTVDEEAGQVSLAVERSGGSAAVSVAYRLESATATAGQDYISQAGNLSWTAGDFSIKYINVPIVNDSLFEEDEYFHVELYAPTYGAGMRYPVYRAIVTIPRNDLDGGPPLNYLPLVAR